MLDYIRNYESTIFLITPRTLKHLKIFFYRTTWLTLNKRSTKHSWVKRDSSFFFQMNAHAFFQGEILTFNQSTKALKGHGNFQKSFIELCNPFSRIENSYSRIIYSFPRISQFVLQDSNTFPRFSQSGWILKSRERIAVRENELPNSKEQIDDM